MGDCVDSHRVFLVGSHVRQIIVIVSPLSLLRIRYLMSADWYDPAFPNLGRVWRGEVEGLKERCWYRLVIVAYVGRRGWMCRRCSYLEWFLLLGFGNILPYVTVDLLSRGSGVY